MIKLKRVYDGPSTTDGVRYLVERLWPRGVKKASLHLDGWIKDAAPGTELRKWFSHDPAKWEEFRRRYFAELDRAPETWEPILLAARHGTVTLLYSSHDTEHNNAVALREYIEHNKRNGTVWPGDTSGGVETRRSHKKPNTGRGRERGPYEEIAMTRGARGISTGRPTALDVYESPAPTRSGQPCNMTQPAAFRPLLVST